LLPQVLHPQGYYAVTSSRTGKLATWDLRPVLHAAAQLVAAAAAAASSGSSTGSGFTGGVTDESAAAEVVLAAAAAAVVKSPLHVEQSGLEGSVVDCMRFLSGARHEV
jgi:hypothetical protein